MLSCIVKIFIYMKKYYNIIFVVEGGFFVTAGFGVIFGAGFMSLENNNNIYLL